MRAITIHLKMTGASHTVTFVNHGKCNKQFNSMRAITIHLKMTGASHTVTFVNHGNYNKNTGFLSSSQM